MWASVFCVINATAEYKRQRPVKYPLIRCSGGIIGNSKVIRRTSSKWCEIADALIDTGLVPICRPVSRNLIDEGGINEAMRVYRDGSWSSKPRLRYSPGLAPTTRLNALLNAASDS
jgi:hypothetical protein